MANFILSQFSTLGMMAFFLSIIGVIVVTALDSSRVRAGRMVPAALKLDVPPQAAAT